MRIEIDPDVQNGEITIDAVDLWWLLDERQQENILRDNAHWGVVKRASEYRYFVSYQYVDGEDRGFGNAQLTLGKRINDPTDIHNLQLILGRETDYDKIIIINYKLMEVAENKS